MVPSGWKPCALIDMTNWSSGGTPTKSNPGYWGGDIPWISAAAMRGQYYSNSDKSITELAVNEKAKMAEKGTILLLVRGSMLWNKIPVGITSRRVAFNQDVKNISPKSQLLDVTFLLYWFLAKENKLMGMVTGTGIGAGKLDTTDLQSLDVFLPPLPEQQKIAKILSTWDKAISTTERLIENSKQQKKALMQQLLTGKKRLQDESGKPFYGEWHTKKLSDVFSFSTASSKTKFIDNSGRNYILDMGSVSRTGRLIPSKRTKISKDYLSTGQLVMPKDDIGGGQIIGRVGYIDKNETYILSDHVYCLTPKSECSLRRKANGTAQLGLGKKDAEKQPVYIPGNIVEQQKIAFVLTNTDQGIDLLIQQLADLKQEKKALMQQLLTGKRRVTV